MFGKPPSVWFIGAVAGVCICLLALDWLVAVDAGIQIIVALAVILSIFAIIGRLILALRPPHGEGTAFVVRTSAPPVLLVLTFVFLLSFSPGELRLALSKNSLDDFARSATSTNLCADGSFRPRWVGLYKIDCADRYLGRVSLRVDDPLAERSGAIWLVGPGDWEIWIQD